MIPPPVTDKIIYLHFNLTSMSTKRNNNDWKCLIQHPFTIDVAQKHTIKYENTHSENSGTHIIVI